MSKIKVAVVGCGSNSKKRHIPEYAANPNVELVGFCDLILERAEGYAQQHGGRAYTNFEEMLKAEKPDAVSGEFRRSCACGEADGNERSGCFGYDRSGKKERCVLDGGSKPTADAASPKG